MYYTDKNGAMRGCIKDGVMTIWQKSWIPKKEYSISITLEELNEALRKGSANSASTLKSIARRKDWEAVEAWIENSKTDELRSRRRNIWENDTEKGKFSGVQDRQEDSIANVIKNLYEKATGHKSESWFEKGK